MTSPVFPIIAVVDDDEPFRLTLRRLLRAHGYRVETFASAEEYLASARRPRTGCLIVDVFMGGMTGLDLQQALARQGAILPTIVVSARDERHVREEARRRGASAFLAKPFDEAALMHAVEPTWSTSASRRGERCDEAQGVGRCTSESLSITT